MKRLNFFDWLTLVLVLIGGLNWGLVGVLDIDFVASTFGAGSAVARVVYSLVGISAIYLLTTVGNFARK